LGKSPEWRPAAWRCPTAGAGAAAAPDGVEREPHQLLEGEDLRPAQLIGRAARPRPCRRAAPPPRRHRPRRRARTSSAPPPISGRKGDSARKPCEAVEEGILRPEHDRRPEDDGAGKRGARPLLALGLAPRIFGGGILVGPDRRHLDEDPGLGGPRRLGTSLGAKGMHRIEALGAGGIENARQVDHRIGALAGRGQRGRIAHIGLHHHDLPGVAQGLQVARKVGPAAGHPDAVAAPGECAHDVPAEKARAADDGDESVGWLNEHGNHPDVAIARPFSAAPARMQRPKRTAGGRTLVDTPPKPL
jgi:hypothetical protein